MANERQPKFQVDQTIEWSSQAAGSWKTKTGKVLAILKPRDSARAALKRLGYDETVGDFVDHAVAPRYLVDATPTGHKGKPRIYVPDFGRAEKNGKVIANAQGAGSA
jgi:hypothetical protein